MDSILDLVWDLPALEVENSIWCSVNHQVIGLAHSAVIASTWDKAEEAIWELIGRPVLASFKGLLLEYKNRQH